MTSKEALEILHEKLLRYDENYDYHDLDIIKQDLDRLEKINAVLHKKIELLECVNINGNYPQQLYDFINKLIDENLSLNTKCENLQNKNKKLKKVIEILKRFNFKVYNTKNNNNEIAFKIYTDSLLETQELTQEEYDLLKEVL